MPLVGIRHHLLSEQNAGVAACAPNPERHEREDRAFTLVEILVVMVVLGILATLLIPVGKRSLEAGRKAVCSANMRQVSAALFAYAADHRGNLPTTFAAGGVKPRWGETLAADGYIPPIPINSIQCNSILFCPSSTVRASGTRFWTWDNGNYGINRNLVGDEGTPTAAPLLGTPLSAILRPAAMVLLLDAGQMGMIYTYPKVPGVQVAYVPGSIHNQSLSWRDSSRQDALYGRHSGKIHVVFADGHIETLLAADLEDNKLWLNR